MRAARGLALLLLLVATRVPAQSAPSSASEGVQRVEGLAAFVGGSAPGPNVLALYRSDVELRARMALLQQGTLEQALGPLPERLLRVSLGELLGEALIALESTRLSLAPPSRAALDDARARLLGPDPARAEQLLAALGVSARELAAWVQRRAVVAAFLQANLEGTLDTSSEELERLFAFESHPFRGESFEAARGRFADWLREQRVQRAVARWVQSLSERTVHRVIASYGAPPE